MLHAPVHSPNIMFGLLLLCLHMPQRFSDSRHDAAHDGGCPKVWEPLTHFFPHHAVSAAHTRRSKHHCRRATRRGPHDGPSKNQAVRASPFGSATIGSYTSGECIQCVGWPETLGAWERISMSHGWWAMCCHTGRWVYPWAYCASLDAIE